MLWDAASAVMAERFLSEGVLPNLARLVGRGALARARPAWPCAQTPPGMATLVTGAPTHVHRIYGYREASRPSRLHAATDTSTGFDAQRLAAEPIWTTAARAGLRSLLLFAPLAHPFEPYGRGAPLGPPPGGHGEILAIDAYARALATQAVLRARDLEPCAPPPPPPSLGALDGARGFRFALALDLAPHEPPRAAPTPATDRDLALEPTLGFMIELGIARAREGAPRAWARLHGAGRESIELPVGLDSARGLHLGPGTGVVLALLDVSPGGDDLLLWRGGVWRVRSSAAAAGAARDLVDGEGPFVGAGGGHSYREGLLGPTCREGGDGVAEERFLSTLRAASRSFLRSSLHAIARYPSDVTVLYEPCVDEAAHIVQDLAEDALAGADGAAACGLDVLRRAYILADEHLGGVMNAVGDRAVVAVASDHGQQGVRRVFRPNVVLQRAGLLATNGDGKIDLSRTRALFGAAANGYVIVNTDDRPHGIVPAAARREVAREAASVLLAARDGGEPLIDDAFFPHERTHHGKIPGEEAGDLYLFSASGVALAAGTAGEPVEPGHGGQHTTALDRPELDALFAVAGPGVPAGARPGRI
jgi:hypothetical protein